MQANNYSSLSFFIGFSWVKWPIFQLAGNSASKGISRPGTHGLSIYIDTRTKCKMSSSKKINIKRNFAKCVYLSEVHNLILPPPPPYTLYTCLQCTIFTQGRGEGEGIEPEKRLEGQQFTKLC